MSGAILLWNTLWCFLRKKSNQQIVRIPHGGFSISRLNPISVDNMKGYYALIISIPELETLVVDIVAIYGKIFQVAIYTSKLHGNFSPLVLNRR